MLFWCFLYLLLIKYGNCQRILKDYVACGDVISDTMNGSEIHFYPFDVPRQYNINFYTCASLSDIVIHIVHVINATTGSDISSSFCHDGDWCGSCTHRNNMFPENFTITAMLPATYVIRIRPYTYPGYGTSSYEFSIHCIDTNASNNMASNTALPNTTTSVTTDFYSTIECDYYGKNAYSISSSQLILDSIAINNNAIKIEFDIQRNDSCNQSSCNILYFGTDDKMQYVSLSINGIGNYFEITFVTDYDFTDIYRIPNTNTLLPVDNDYHNIYLILNDHPNVFKMGTFVRYYYSTSLSPYNATYQLYMSNEEDPTTYATVSNLCIQSPMFTNDKCEVCGAEITCGETVTSMLTSSSDIDYLYFNLSADTTNSHSKVMFDSCGSSYDTYLYLYDINFNILFQGDDEGDCGTKEQLTIDPLHSGEYILGVSGYGVESFHSYGEWEIHILCSDSELVNETVNPNQLPYASMYDSFNFPLHWWEIETACEQEYETSLATVITEQDMKDAVDLVRYFNPFATNISVYIG
eukprot:742792_1